MFQYHVYPRTYVSRYLENDGKNYDSDGYIAGVDYDDEEVYEPTKEGDIKHDE